MTKKFRNPAAILTIAVTAALPALFAQQAKGEERPRDFQSELELHQPASEWPDGDFIIVGASGDRLHLGPTGLWGKTMGQNLRVTKVEPGSPADGKIQVDDFIYGVNGKAFPADQDPSVSFAHAITEAETEEAGGVLKLDVRSNGQFIQVPLQLQVMGSFSETTPYNCEKSDRIVARAEQYMIRGMRPKTGAPLKGHYMYGPFNDTVLFAMATGNPEMQGLVRRYIRNTLDTIEQLHAEGKSYGGNKGWNAAFLKLLFGEYYHLTGDPSVLPYLKPGGFHPPGSPQHQAALEKKWVWPPTEPTAYGTHPHAHMASTMGEVLANEAGLEMNQSKIFYDLQYLYVKRAEYGIVNYCGYGAKPIEHRQAEGVEPIPEEKKKTGMFSAMNGKPGMAAALYSMVEGYDKAVYECSRRSLYAFNRTDRGHGGIWFNGFWTPIGASKAGPEQFTFFMKGMQPRRELLRHHDGSIWQEGNARGKSSHLATGFAIHRTIPRKKLRMLGAPKSMFGPSYPPYMEEALVAHLKHDYALAEQLTLKLQADGVVPAEDEERVNHYLDTARMLKESVEHDLNYAEDMIREGNYLMASIELPQLKMVVSPDNPRLQAIERAVESNKDKIPDLEKLREQRMDDYFARRKVTEGDKESEFHREANSPVLIKDGAKILGIRSRRNSKFFPQYRPEERTEMAIRRLPLEGNVPMGWEQPNFDDSSWEKTKLHAHLNPWQINLFRTTLHVDNPANIDVLRFRISANEFREYYNHVNLSLYLNGKLVTRCAMVPENITFDLPRHFNHLLQSGSNTFAMRVDSQRDKRPFTLRLIAVQKDGSANANTPKRQKNNAKHGGESSKAPSPKKQNLAPHHREIESMLAHLKKVQPKMKIGENEFPGIKVHDFLASVYRENSSQVTSTEFFLEKIATQSPSGMIYYVLDDKGGKTPLKDWLKASHPR
ncbi:MAG: DUF6288 domain-containing protein [Akkermansiaceae bacterium]|nr:DUF6288 domain-containing protein [Akkermansiaceae bacterium]